jgi:hypothetical protein
MMEIEGNVYLFTIMNLWAYYKQQSTLAGFKAATVPVKLIQGMNPKRYSLRARVAGARTLEAWTGDPESRSEI